MPARISGKLVSGNFKDIPRQFMQEICKKLNMIRSREDNDFIW